MRSTTVTLCLVVILLAESVAAEKKTKTATAVKTGLPGMTPAKKEMAAQKTASKAAKGNPIAAASPPSAPYAQYRLKLQEAYCPTADKTDKASLACKSYAISKQMKGATEEMKKQLIARKQKLYADEGRKTDEEKKQTTHAAKELYTKAFAKYCVGTQTTSDPVCTNLLMKKMYGPQKKKTTVESKA